MNSTKLEGLVTASRLVRYYCEKGDGSMDWAEGYANPKADQPRKGVVIANWNDYDRDNKNGHSLSGWVSTIELSSQVELKFQNLT